TPEPFNEFGSVECYRSWDLDWQLRFICPSRQFEPLRVQLTERFSNVLCGKCTFLILEGREFVFANHFHRQWTVGFWQDVEDELLELVGVWLVGLNGFARVIQMGNRFRGSMDRQAVFIVHHPFEEITAKEVDGNIAASQPQGTRRVAFFA